MRKYRRVVIALTIGVVASVAALNSLRPSEPYYKGKPLTVWLRGYNGTSSVEDPVKADDAVSFHGTNAIPTLLRLISARETAYTRLVHWMHDKGVPGFRQDSSLASDLNYQGRRGFMVLGLQATNAVPELMRIYDANVSESSQFYTLLSLIEISPVDSVDRLVKATTDTNSMKRAFAVEHLGIIHARPEVAVPALIRCLNDPGEQIQHLAVEALGRFKGNAKAAVPSLKLLVHGTPDLMVARAAKALNDIEPGSAREAIPALVEMKQSENRYFRELAEKTLKEIQETNAPVRQ